MKKIFCSAVLALCASAVVTGTAWADDLQPAMQVKANYPVVALQNAAAQKRINLAVAAEMDDMQRDIKAILREGDLLSASLDSRVSYQDEKIISIRTDKYVYVDKAAHPMSWEYGRIYRISDGKLLTLEDIANLPEFRANASRYTLDNVAKAIGKKYGDVLFSRIVKLESMPKDIYLDENKQLHVLIQRYELAPYAAGILDVNLDE